MIIYYTLSGGGRADSHRLLEEAIAEYTGDREKAGTLVSGMKTGENGKPYIEGFDHFSISHSAEAWAVLFCEMECGLDIQYGRKCDVLSIARRWYNPIDAGAVFAAAEGGEGESAEEFFRLWARREALVKALGGTVYDTELPAVCGGAVSAGGREFVITDIDIAGREDIYAAICIRKEEYENSDGGSVGLSGKPHAYCLRAAQIPER